MIHAKNTKEQLEILKRGAIEIISEKELTQKIEESLKKQRPLRIKLGIDPTAPDLHLGHSVTLKKLRQFQDLGHKVILIIGDFTAQIGDPTGRSETRKVLTQEEIKKNIQTYLNQLEKILKTDNPELFELKYNSEWLSPLTFQKILELTQHFTVAQLLEREDFKKRYEKGIPIGLHEFFYPLMQGYDSVAIQSDVELGATEQKFNILIGRELQRIFGMESPQVALFLPILEGTDGIQKMSKSFGNYIGITDPPDEMFGKLMSIPDLVMPRYYELLTNVSEDEIRLLKKALSSGVKRVAEDGTKVELTSKASVDFREWKAQLAKIIVDFYHGKNAGVKAEENFNRIHRDKQVPENIPEFHVPVQLLESVNPTIGPGKVPIPQLLVMSGLATSIRNAKRLIAQRGVQIDGKTLRDENQTLQVKNGIIIKVGKKNFIKLRIP